LIDIQTQAEKALTVGVHEGVLKKRGGRHIPVHPDLRRALERWPRASLVASADFPWDADI
jgi:hypothetical protein